MSHSRRYFLQSASALGLAGVLPLAHANRSNGNSALTATWQRGSGYQLGTLGVRAEQLAITRAFDLPTRGHGLLREADGAVLAVARRPGDWLLRWHPDTGHTQWHWLEPERAFTGHLLHVDGALLTTETDLLSGAGLLGVRDPHTLEKRAEWPTGGIDPHALTRLGHTVLVANGGVPTAPETGRARRQDEAVDSSLAAIDLTSGRLRQQWRLPDSELSLRHLAWGLRDGTPLLGVALQAQHGQAEQRAKAPVLALWDGTSLHTATVAPELRGYGGDITFADGRFVIGCPKADRLATFTSAGALQRLEPLAQACAVAVDTTGQLWAAGRTGTAHLQLAESLQLDNHWLA